jgi:PAS domain S-box-containing protein
MIGISVLESWPDGVFLCGRDGHIRFANTAAQDLCGKTRTELLTRFVWDGCPALANDAFRHAFDQAVAGRVNILRVVDPRNGNLFRAHVGSSGHGVAVLVTDRDQLEERVERAELSLGMAAHDLQTPLAAIAGLAHALLGTGAAASPLNSRLLRRILSNTTRMSRLVTGILDCTRLSHGWMLDTGPFDLGEACDDILDTVRSVHPRVQIDIERAGDLVGIWDSDRMLQVIQNLVVNAIDHGLPDHPVRVFVDGRAQDTVVMNIRNHGATRATMDQLSSPYESSRPYGGAGLGLFIARSIVESHGGHVEINCNLDGGDQVTVLTVTLPRQRATEASEGGGGYARDGALVGSR